MSPPSCFSTSPWTCLFAGLRIARDVAQPVRVGQLRKRLTQGLAPARTDALEILVIGVDAHVARDAELVALDDDEVERQSDGEVRADGRVHRHDRALHRFVQAAGATEHAIDDRLAVLRLADLEVARVARRLDEVAGGVDTEQPRRLTLDLPAEREARIEIDGEILERGRIAP